MAYTTRMVLRWFHHEFILHFCLRRDGSYIAFKLNYRRHFIKNPISTKLNLTGETGSAFFEMFALIFGISCLCF